MGSLVKHRSGVFGIFIPNGLSKIIQRICNLVFYILWELGVQILEDKAKRPLLTFVSMPLYVLFQMECSLPKVLQKYSLRQIRILYLSWNCTICIKLGENQQRVVCKVKQKLCIFRIMMPSWLSKIILGFCNMVLYILWGFRCNFLLKMGTIY